MFQVNDMVLYGTNGVCKVVDIMREIAAEEWWSIIF